MLTGEWQTLRVPRDGIIDPRGKRPHPSFGKIAGNFTEIHLPLNRKLRLLGKALGWLRVNLPSPAPERRVSGEGGSPQG